MKKWSKLYDVCQICKSSSKRHMAKGLCVYCYLNQYHNNPRNIVRVKSQKKAYYLQKQKPQSQLKREIRYFDNLRQTVLCRDNRICQKCGQTNNLVVHHKDELGRGKKNPNNILENLITLCRACHINAHRDSVLKNRFRKGIQRWAKEYDMCINCNKTNIPHNSHGRCRNCHMKFRRQQKKI